MTTESGIRAPNLPLGTSLSEFLGIETVGSQKSVKRFTRASVIGGIEAVANSFTVGGGVIFTTLSQAIANLNYDANKMAWVIQDATPANNGVYQKTGASGSGSWSRLGDLPYSFYRAANEGAGTANAIQATNGYPMASQDALIVVNITDTNTATPVTLSLNGAAPITIKTASGNDPAAGGLIAGMVMAGYIDAGGTQFRLLSDQASAVIVPAAEAAQAAAEAAKVDSQDAAAAAIGATGIAQFATKSAAEATTLPASTKHLSLAGYSTVGVGPWGVAVRVASAPSHAAKLRTADRFLPNGSTDSSNGGWWALADAIISPVMLGAVADGDGAGGGTNNATAFQAALDFAGALKRPVRLLPGVYRCDSALTVPADIEIVGYGATIDFKTAGNVTGLLFANGGSISGVKLIGAGNAAMNSNGVAIACRGTKNTAAAPTFVTAPNIRDCIIDKWAGYGVSFGYINRGRVTGCQITNIGYAGVGGTSCNDTIVDGNLIDGVTPGSGGGDAYGCFIDRNDGTSETEDPRSFRCSMINNTVKNVVSVAGNNGQALDTHGGVDFRFIGNTISDCEVGIFLTASSISGVQMLGPKRCIVQSNTISGGSVGYGIMVSGAFAGSSVNDYAEGCIVSDCTINGFGIAGDATSGAINAQGTKGLILTGNTMKWPRVNGIRLNVGNIGFQCSGNFIFNPYDNSVTVPACVGVLGGDNRGYIGGNTFSYTADAVGTYIAVQAVRVPASLSGLDLVLTRNACVGKTTGHLDNALLTTTGVDSAYI